MNNDEKKIFDNLGPTIIAEISGNHNQSLENAILILKEAKKNDIKYIKLQTYTPDTITVDSDDKNFLIEKDHKLWGGRKLYDIYNEAYTPWEWHKTIYKEAKEMGITCFSSPFDETAVDFLEKINNPFYKVASFEITHIPLIKKIASTKKPVIVSTGMATIKEIDEATNALARYGCSKFALLKCTSTYPSDPKDSNILTIPELKKKYNCEVGISDHTLGIGVSIAAVALGATIIEKHITLNKNDGGIDSKFSLEPKEFSSLIKESYRAWESLGRVNFGPVNNELKSLKHRRSIYVIQDMKKGDKISKDLLKIIRPSDGLMPKFFEEVLGKEIKFDIKKNTPLNFDMIK